MKEVEDMRPSLEVKQFVDFQKEASIRESLPKFKHEEASTS